jgi:hypothetical protein
VTQSQWNTLDGYMMQMPPPMVTKASSEWTWSCLVQLPCLTVKELDSTPLSVGVISTPRLVKGWWLEVSSPFKAWKYQCAWRWIGWDDGILGAGGQEGMYLGEKSTLIITS